MSAAGAYFTIVPWWVVVLYAVFLAVFPKLEDFCRWLADRPQASFLGTYFTNRIAHYSVDTARKMATHHAYDDTELDQLAAASPTPPTPPEKPKRKRKPATLPDSTTPPTKRRARSTGSSAAQPTADTDSDPPPDAPRPQRHLRLVRPDETTDESEDKS